MPPEMRTRATLRSAEFGFFGVVVYTRVQTPRRCGEPFNAGVLVFSTLFSRPLRTSWAIVGIHAPCCAPAPATGAFLLLTSIPRARAFKAPLTRRASRLVAAAC